MTPRELKAAFARGEIEKPEYIERMFEHHRALFDYAELLAGTDIAEIKLEAGRVEMTTRSGLRLICDPEDRRLAPFEILNFGAFERRELEVVLELLGPNDCMLDVGANIGWYAMNVARRLPDARIYAFEPIPETYRKLLALLELNTITNVNPLPFGLAEREEERTFFFDPEGSGNASARDLSGKPGVRSVHCTVKRLDDFVRAEQISVDLIKCDVEGAELFVLQGARQTLARDRPAVFAEMLRKWSARFGYHPNAIIELMRELGYACFAVGEHGLQPFAAMDEATTATNFFFLHEERHAPKLSALRGR